MRGARLRTTAGSRLLRTSSAARRARSGSTTVTSSPISAAANDRRCGRFCSQTPPSSVSPRRCSDRAPVVLAQHHARRRPRPHARVGGDGEAHLGRPRRAGGVRQRGDGQDLLLGDRDRHAVELDSPGARQDPHQPVELGRQQHAAVRRSAAGLEQRVRAQIHVLDLQPRRLGRVGEPACQRAAQRRLAPVRLDQHARQPQSSFAAREPVADPRDRALGRRGAFFLRRRREIAAAATCSHGLTRAGQSHSDSFSVG